MFNINYDTIIKLLLPVGLRKEAMVAYLNAMLRPLKNLYNTFSSYRLNVLIKITHTGQVMYLEHLLNQEFNTLSNTIYISDSDNDRIDDYLYNAGDGQTPMYLYNAFETETPEYIYNGVEYNAIDDFIINIPDSIDPLPTTTEVRRLVERYRQAGKQYSINYYTIITT